ncbi:MAG: endonuclease/exonuclease/phosphatase family protein [Sulfitobacter sp.]
MTDVVHWIGSGIFGLLVILTFLPLSKLSHGVVHGGAFVRVQIFWVASLLAAIGAVMGLPAWLELGALLIAGVNLLYIIKFTPIWPKQSVEADLVLQQETERHISVLSVNVKQSNRDYENLIALVRKYDVDVVSAVEVDGPWIEALKEGLGHAYDHWVEVPKDNTYGMCILSRLPLSGIEVRDVVTEGVPSVRMVATLRSGEDVLVYVVHPEPPVINHDSKGRDSEIAHIGLEAAKDEMPVIVTGDLNDVAWSTTTRRFQRLSGLLDPRVGRGFFNSFHAYHWWARWPLDHLFHDPQFRLLHMARLEKIGSDHFPMLFELALADTEAQISEVGEADASETQEVRQMIKAEKQRDRDPIGADWED